MNCANIPALAGIFLLRRIHVCLLKSCAATHCFAPFRSPTARNTAYTQILDLCPSFQLREATRMVLV